jgi:hypothetical protein
VTFSNTKKITIACMAMMAFIAAQAPPAAPAKKFKDDKEQAEAVAANVEKDPKAKLEKLDKWKADYPQTEYEVERIGAYFDTYGQLKMYHEQVQADEELRKTLTDNLQLLRAIFADVPLIKSPAADDLAAMVDAANYIINNPDKVFDPKNKPQGQSDAEWNNLKPAMIEYSKNQLDWVAQQQGTDAAIARLKQDPTRINLNVWLGQQYVTQGKTDAKKIVLALFHYARVAQYDGPGAQPAATKAAAKRYFDKQYAGYHGSTDGADQVLAVAKANAVPPDGFDIESITSISERKIKEDEEKRKANPMITLWTDTKKALTGDGGPAYFDQIKDALMPGAAVPGVTKFKGKIVSMTPASRPKKIVLAVEKDGVADCALVLETALPGNMEVGSELEFDGTVKEFTKDPYMLTFAVEKDNISGWTGKNAPAAHPQQKKKTTP